MPPYPQAPSCNPCTLPISRYTKHTLILVSKDKIKIQRTLTFPVVYFYLLLRSTSKKDANSTNFIQGQRANVRKEIILKHSTDSVSKSQLEPKTNRSEKRACFTKKNVYNLWKQMEILISNKTRNVEPNRVLPSWSFVHHRSCQYLRSYPQRLL